MGAATPGVPVRRTKDPTSMPSASLLSVGALSGTTGEVEISRRPSPIHGGHPHYPQSCPRDEEPGRESHQASGPGRNPVGEPTKEDIHEAVGNRQRGMDWRLMGLALGDRRRIPAPVARGEGRVARGRLAPTGCCPCHCS